MRHSDPSPTARREFLGQLAVAAAAVAGTAACAAPSAATQAPAPIGSAPAGANASAAAPAAATSAASGPAPAPIAWDDSWTRRVQAAKHKAVFDSPEVQDGLALMQAALFVRGYTEALQASAADIVPVVVIRHTAVPLLFNDEIWEKYGVGKELKLTDHKTKQPPLTNPFLKPDASLPADSPTRLASLEGLHAHGAVLLGCNIAAMGYAYRFAKATNQEVAKVREEVRASLIPGAILLPSGIYATLRAQEVGAVFMRSA